MGIGFHPRNVPLEVSIVIYLLIQALPGIARWRIRAQRRCCTAHLSFLVRTRKIRTRTVIAVHSLSGERDSSFREWSLNRKSTSEGKSKSSRSQTQETAVQEQQIVIYSQSSLARHVTQMIALKIKIRRLALNVKSRIETKRRKTWGVLEMVWGGPRMMFTHGCSST